MIDLLATMYWHGRLGWWLGFEMRWMVLLRMVVEARTSSWVVSSGYSDEWKPSRSRWHCFVK